MLVTLRATRESSTRYRDEFPDKELSVPLNLMFHFETGTGRKDKLHTSLSPSVSPQQHEIFDKVADSPSPAKDVARVYLKVTICCIIFESCHCTPAKIKRAPLEIGLISFNDVPKHQFLKVNLTRGHHHTLKTGNTQHVWIPGYVKHHAYIPAHEHHIIIPPHEVIVARPIQTLLLPLNSNIYRTHIGGFGVGVDFGGRGAGHGFHISMINL
ncbi:hypothetical protein FQA39_LY06126 [Lamprigera yunnana]|nr:hypothetical protein FQA39_LY06126 [Lamprigera yunnana]